MVAVPVRGRTGSAGRRSGCGPGPPQFRARVRRCDRPTRQPGRCAPRPPGRRLGAGAPSRKATPPLCPPTGRSPGDGGNELVSPRCFCRSYDLGVCGIGFGHPEVRRHSLVVQEGCLENESGLTHHLWHGNVRDIHASDPDGDDFHVPELTCPPEIDPESKLN